MPKCYRSPMQSLATDQPLVTVIIPTIGRPAFIVDTLRSVLAQTYANLQILISDNAPAEATKPLLTVAGIVDTRIEVVEQATRLGFSTHMNVCIAHARGDFLMIVSDDDQITSNYVEEMVTLMIRQPNVCVCLGRQLQINENDTGLISKPIDRLPQQIFDGVDFLKGTLSGTLQSGILTYISMFVRRNDILRVGGFRDYPDGSHADNLILFKLALNGRVALGASLMFYRVYLDSFGLRTPFSALLEATRSYTSDIACALQKSTIPESERRTLYQLVQSSNAGMLLARIRHVYWYRLGVTEVFMCIIRALYFKLHRIPL